MLLSTYRLDAFRPSDKVVDEAIEFASASSTYHYYNKRDKGEWRNYRGYIEYFGVYCPQIDRAFLVPVDIVGKTAGVLRLELTGNNQEKGVHWAKDYEI